MDATLHALGQLLLQSIPTIVFFGFLYIFLRQVFFTPVGAILEERRKATEGVRELSQRAFAEADRKASEFDRAIQLARQEIAAENEALRKHWAAENAETLARARAEAEAKLEAAKREIAAEVARAEAELEGRIEPISEGIVNSLLRRRAA